MAQISHTCDRCGREGVAVVTESISSIKGYVWNTSFLCAFCGNRVEGQGGRPAPSYVRDAIISQEGRWSLRVMTSGASRMKAVKALRTALSLPIDAAAHLKAAMPGVVAQGTRGEMDYLVWILAQEGISAIVDQ